MKMRFINIVLWGYFLSTGVWSAANLLPDERNTIEVFQTASPKVVFVHRLATVMDQMAQVYQVSAGTGSGIIWDSLGHVVTNYHVIDGAEKLAVTIGKLTVLAKVIGTEPRKDIAVLQIASKQAMALLKNFKPLVIAHTHDLLVGQKTLAIGNPFGLDHTLTTGIISALGRQLPGIGGVMIHEMIQTDASINPGNSGGPLLDSSGRLIGLNSVIFSGSGSSAGIGFAVPAEEIERIVTQIIQHGRVKLAGIGIQRVAPKVALKLGVSHGILIADVLPNTPAASAGLLKTYRDHWGRIVLGDIIVGINGHPINDYDELYYLSNQIAVGSEVEVTVLRGQEKKTFKMKTIDIEAY
jgi:S1-C subfamily serine protease